MTMFDMYSSQSIQQMSMMGDKGKGKVKDVTEIHVDVHLTLL
jgi:hypothetical protein